MYAQDLSDLRLVASGLGQEALYLVALQLAKTPLPAILGPA
jgi:hypothetical protein